MSNFNDKITTRLILIRHGQSIWNAEKRLAGQADVPVSELGRSQILRQKEMVQAMQPETVLCSDLRRARQSAALLGFDSPQIDQRLREANLGQWEGKYIANLPIEQYQAWRAGTFTPPRGESWEIFCDRVEELLTELITKRGHYLIVTHGGVIRATCDRLLALYPQQIVPVSPASMTILDVSDQPRLSVFNLGHYFSYDRFD